MGWELRPNLFDRKVANSLSFNSASERPVSTVRGVVLGDLPYGQRNVFAKSLENSEKGAQLHIRFAILEAGYM